MSKYMFMIEGYEVRAYKKVAPGLVKSLSTGKAVRVTPFMDKHHFDDYSVALKACRRKRATR